jgi:hypothetical protein
MNFLICQQEAPVGAVSPQKIICDGLFKTNIDDKIQQDLEIHVEQWLQIVNNTCVFAALAIYGHSKHQLNSH